MKSLYTHIILLIFFTAIFPNNYSNSLISNESYISGDDGVIRMNINVIGHVRNPGVFLVYDGIDLMTTLSVAGGFLEGSNLENVIIYSKDGEKKVINLSKYINDNEGMPEIKLNPHDTIFIKQKILSKYLTSSRLPSLVLSILNIILTLDQQD
tara:strand:- start:127 stop:585 length:459 start_codon:yes stop_codon:yes gene_type:complete